MTYQKFLEYQIDLSELGVIPGSNMEPYFCTPKGAEIFGRAGVDGIHYCFIDGFGDMVFTVSPMNTPGNYVHPIAESFEDFLRLLLACGNDAAIEQTWMWDLDEFDAFLADNQPTDEQKSILEQLADRTGLRPMDQPWQYIKKLQSGFDSSRIEYTEDYYDLDMNPNAIIVPPPWEVRFERGFWGGHGKGNVGTEIPINQEYEFAGHKWIIPAVYSCGKGLVVDFCMQVPAEEIRAFMDKWALVFDEDSKPRFTKEERLELEADNPMSLDFRPKAVVNGKELCCSHGYGTSYNPCVTQGLTNELEAKWVIDHYGIDSTCGWSIWRYSFPWSTAKRPKIKSLSLTLCPELVLLPGPHFQVNAPGDSFSFTHPETKAVHTLTVVEYEQQTMDFSRMPDQNKEYPSHCIAMSYCISPELSQHEFSISDCADSDQPRMKSADPFLFRPQSTDSVMVGVIGGADGPTTIIVGGATEKPHATCSSLHFEPVESVKWRIIFHVNRSEEKTIDLNILGERTEA